MNGNIIGEEFDEFVLNQISQRQNTQGSGFNSSSRSIDNIQYLTNRNAWVKLASSVEISDGKIDLVEDFKKASKPLKKKQTASIDYTNQNAGKERLKKLEIENPDSFLGSKLAENAILFNTFSSLGDRTKDKIYTPRYGVTATNSLWNNSSYGLGGTQQGITPPPGIQDVQINCINRGSIRKATVTLKAYNKFQFEIIEILYLRLGFTMMLEWGWDKYLNKDGSLETTTTTLVEDKWFQSKNISQLDMLNFIQSYREKYQGNYDGFFGKVSNFSWGFDSDGTYNITINLITLGDVIESLKTNVSPPLSIFESITVDDNTNSPPKLKGLNDNNIFANLKDKNIIKSATLNVIGYFLYSKIKNLDWGSKNPNTNYFSLKDTLNKFTETSTSSAGTGAKGTTVVNKGYPTQDNAKDNFNYFIRLGEFLNNLKPLLVPQISNGEESIFYQIEFDTTSNNRISYFPNQISLDPRVCIFKPSFNELGISGVKPPLYLDSLKNYVERKNEDSYGNLMNLYLNFDFISSLILANKSEEFSLYQFLKGLCNGINQSLGGVNKLEPVIKDDYFITLIDQTYSPPPPSNKTDIVDLEVYGYNVSNNSSNFVKKIDFQTQITPKLSSMISIGATAAGSNSRDIDGTAFSKWSNGLIDRFNQSIYSSVGSLIEINSNQSQIDKETKEKKDRFRSFLKDNKKYFNQAQLKDNQEGWTSINYPNIQNGVYTFDDLYHIYSEIERIRIQNKRYTKDEILNSLDKDYYLYLLSSFGGTANGITMVDSANSSGSEKIYSIDTRFSKYSTLNESWMEKGKILYKEYLTSLNNQRFEEDKTPSTLIGFLPLTFNVDLDGISGVKIYNKLNIRTDFLPSNYPESLKFIISKVDHKISNNNWETSLSTLTQTISEPYKTLSQTLTKKTNGSSPDNDRPFLILDGRNNRNLISVNDVLKELNPTAIPKFTEFFKILQSSYSGYTVIINSINRTWVKQRSLYLQNPQNALPGLSKHNYGMAIDLNIETPPSTTKRTLIKSNREPWIEEGLHKVAEQSGLIWGGNISGYVDCVHFAVDFNLKNTYNSISEKFPYLGDDPLDPITLAKIDKSSIKII